MKGGWLPYPVSVDVSLARMPNGIDTNDSYDWVITSFTTEGKRNTLGPSSPGYGLVAQNSTKEPTINGVVLTGEWGDSKFDISNVGGFDYFSVYAKLSNSYLFVSVTLDPFFDSVMDMGDICAVGFDTKHNHTSSPQFDDWYVEVSFDGLSTQWEAFQGTGTAWGPQAKPLGWEADMSDSGGTELSCEFKIDASVIFDKNEGEVIGFGVYVYDEGSGDRVYWPESAYTCMMKARAIGCIGQRS
jgi:hypothetical protein